MKVCVFGAGAVGGHIALRCQRAGADTSVISRGNQLAAIRANGLRVVAGEDVSAARVKATDDPRDLGPQDAIIVAVKAPALAAVAATIAPLLGPDTAVVFAMNGVPWWYFHQHGGPYEGTSLPTLDPDGALGRVVGAPRTVGCVVYAPSAVVEPGVIRLAQPKSRLVLGEPDGTLSERVTVLAALLERGGLPTTVSTAIRDEIWAKLQNNVASGLIAILTQRQVNEFAAEYPCESTMRSLLVETSAVAEALGRNPPREVDRVVTNMRALAHKPSILQDLEAGRPMEMEAMFGVLLRLARLGGVETPTLDLMVTLARLRAEGAGLAARPA